MSIQCQTIVTIDVIVATAELTVTKTADPTTYAAADEVITYTILVENTGNITVTDISVTDRLTRLTQTIASLAPAASQTYTLTYTITQANVDAGSVRNTATEPEESGYYSVSDTDDETITGTQEPGITLEKTGSIDMTIVAPPVWVDAGDQITYTFTVTNTGNVTLTDVTITDPLITVTGSSLASLAPGASDATTFTGTYTLTQADIDAGTFTNTAEAEGTYNNIQYTDTDDDIQTFTPSPSIELIKTGTYVDTNIDGIYSAGDQISYEFSITNTGNVTLVNITISDPVITINGGPLTPLDPGETNNTEYTGLYTLSQADIDAGTFTNLATVSGRFRNEEYTDSDDDTQTFTQSPLLSVEKVVDVDEISAPATLTYTITVTNTGNVSLTNVTVADDLAGTATLTSGDADSDGVLDVGEAWSIYCHL